jgi:hypothetical protein
MNWKPILMTGPLVKSTMEDVKTQTRRVVTVPWAKGKRVLPYEPYYEEVDGRLFFADEYGDSHPMEKLSPFGQAGDRLWVRETHYLRGRWIKNGKTKTGRQRWTFKAARGRRVRYADNPPSRLGSKRGASKVEWWKRPSIFMPRWACRLRLEITGIRVERLQAITYDGMKAEGCFPASICGGERRALLALYWVPLWDSINAGRGYGWEVNPWVWVIEYKRIRNNAV